ncbi:MAG: hypothetical protein ACRCVA_24275, partial [Phreatobacter sp.]
TDYATPALRAADDDALLPVWTATTELLRHLAANNPAHCRDIAFDTITGRDIREPRTRHLFEAMMRASEAAYHNGKGRPGRPAPSPADQAAMTDALGISEGEQALLVDRAGADPEAFCAAATKLLTGMAMLPLPIRSGLIRWFLTAP